RLLASVRADAREARLAPRGRLSEAATELEQGAQRAGRPDLVFAGTPHRSRQDDGGAPGRDVDPHALLGERVLGEIAPELEAQQIHLGHAALSRHLDASKAAAGR